MRNSGGHHQFGGGFGCGHSDGYHQRHDHPLPRDQRDGRSRFAIFFEPEPDEVDGTRTRVRRRRNPQLPRRRS